jgi:hypothetical protein
MGHPPCCNKLSWFGVYVVVRDRTFGGRFAMKRLLRLVFVVLLAIARCAAEDKAVESKDPLTAEEIAVYKAFIASYDNGSGTKTNLSEVTMPLNTKKETCMMPDVHWVGMEKKANTFHRIRGDEFGPKVHRVDPKAQAERIKESDPGGAIRQGKSVENAVRDGFASGLLELSEVVFDETGRFAMMSYSFRCGSLCGSGRTMVFEKKKGVWRKTQNCGGWIS